MKRQLSGFFILCFGLILLASCGSKKTNEPSSDTLNAIIATLETAGYDLTAFDKDSRDYHAAQVKTLHGIDVVIEAYYAGYVSVDSQQTRYARVLLFEVSSQAIDYVNAFTGTEEGLLLYRDGSVVIYTFSDATISLFDN